MTESLTMAALYEKLSKIGLKKNYVRKMACLVGGMMNSMINPLRS